MIVGNSHNLRSSLSTGRIGVVEHKRDLLPGCWLVEGDLGRGEIRVVAYGQLPRAYLAARVRRRCRRYRRDGYEVVATFAGRNLELFGSWVHSLDWDRPRVPMAGAQLRRAADPRPRRPGSLAIGTDEDTLAWVRRRLDTLVFARLDGPLSLAESVDYDTLATEEERLLHCRTEGHGSS